MKELTIRRKVLRKKGTGKLWSSEDGFKGKGDPSLFPSWFRQEMFTHQKYHNAELIEVDVKIILP